MEESQVADYFVVTGLPNDPEPMDDYTDHSHLKPSSSLPPITDITVIFPGNDEFCPDGWECIVHTPTGLTANLNYGSMHGSEVYVCYKRGRNKPPLVDIGVLYENKDRILPDSEIVRKTPTGKLANVNSTARTFLTYRRAKDDMHANELVVTDICVIVASKGEKAPHAFCAIKKNLNKGIFGGEVYLCYKKSMNRAHVISYKPEILCRYPLWDRTEWKLHSNVPLFCLPMGASLELWPPEASQPPTVFSTFILTVSDAAEKVYGSAVTFYEKYPIEKLTKEQLSILLESLKNDEKCESKSNFDLSSTSSNFSKTEKCDENSKQLSQSSGIPEYYTVNVNKCICLLSHWPFFDTFETFLTFLYKLSTTGPHSVPIERYISHFLETVPFPSPQRPRILVQLSAEDRVTLFQPEDLPLPRSGAGFRDLLLNLGPEDSLLVLLLVLTEHKILVHSLRPSILTAVVEALSMIIFPFKWQCPYIPLCPLGLAEVLHAPLPFLIGVDSRFFDLYDPPADVTCVDLDTNNITIPEERRSLSYKLLPKRAARNLKCALDELFKKCCEKDDYLEDMRDDDDINGMMQFHHKERESEDKSNCSMCSIEENESQKLQLEIQEAFLRFMATILKGYRSYLLPITRAPTVGTTDPSSLFDLQGFLKSRERAHHKFFMMLMKTQMFIRFIEERSFVSDMDAGLAFFDECTEKVDSEDSSCRLLDYEETHKSERTVFIPPPEPTGLPAGASYLYQGFNLDSNLFRSVEIKNCLNVASQENMPGSPMARRTKHEVKSAQKLARRKHLQSPQSWAKYLLTTCYSLWFIHLPSFVLFDGAKSSICLKIAYDLLVKIQKLKLHPTDEVCYRVMMQLFGIHSQPVLAVNLLSQMKMCGIQPNALTYGYYNRAVLEAKWPADSSHPSHLWSKLRNVIIGAALFRRGGHRISRNKLPEAESCTSLSSLEKGDFMTEFEVFDRKRSRIGSIVKPHSKNLQEVAAHQSIESIAGILMTGLKKSTPFTERRSSFSEFSSKLQQCPSMTSETNTSRLRRGSMSPTLPENKMLTILMRSDSFANDTSIVQKHNRTNKLNDKGLVDLIPNNLSIPRESTESLDITDDFSLDDSWNSAGDSIQNNRSTPTEKLSNLSPSGNEIWAQSNWKTSLEESEIVKGVSSEKLSKQPIKVKSDRCGGNILLENTEDLCGANVISRINEVADDSHLGGDEGNDDSSLVKTSPIRVPVTENDPLGALQSKCAVNGNDRENVTENEDLNSPQKSCVEDSKIKYDLATYDLFSNSRRRSLKKVDEDIERINKINIKKKGVQGDTTAFSNTRVPKSATFHHGKEKEAKGNKANKGHMAEEEENMSSRKAIQRSTTMPDATAVAVSSSPSVASSLSHLGSSLKFSFSRYSPSRLSLKKSDLRIAKAQILENAISGSKKSNELLLSGYNTFKSAATSIAKKIEEAISTNTTPVKSTNIVHEIEEDDMDLPVEKSSAIDFEYWGSNLKELFGDGNRKGSSANLQTQGLDEQNIPEEIIIENLYGKKSNHKTSEEPAALSVVMTTCCKCNNCNSVLYDEEIVSGWTPDDSNLNTKCHFCGKSTLPFLSVTIYDCRRTVGSESLMYNKTGDNTCLSHSSSNTRLNISNLSVNNINEKQTKAEIVKDDPVCREKFEKDESVTNKTDTVFSDSEPVISLGGGRGEKLEPEYKLGKTNCWSAENDTRGEISFNEGVELNNEAHALEPINVPYLNPLVLRKELENILQHEGDQSLTKPSFVDQHPIIYWNMVWFFERINVSSHLPGLAPHCMAVNKDQDNPLRSKHEQNCVSIRCLWDNRRLHEEIGQPMYVLWQQQDSQSGLVNALVTERIAFPKSVIHNVIINLMCDNLYEPMRQLVNERKKLRKKGFGHSHSLYRNILFLAIALCGRGNINLDHFDREYNKAYDRLKAEGVDLLKCDKPPVSASFRNYFRPLLL